MRCKCCDNDVPTYFLRDGFYCKVCVNIIKETVKDMRMRDLHLDQMSGGYIEKQDRSSS